MLDCSIKFDMAKIVVSNFEINGTKARISEFGQIKNQAGEIVFVPKDVSQISEDILYKYCLSEEDLYEVFEDIEDSIPMIDLEVVDLDEEDDYFE